MFSPPQMAHSRAIDMGQQQPAALQPRTLEQGTPLPRNAERAIRVAPPAQGIHLDSIMPRAAWYLSVKSFVEFFIALILLVPAIPIMLLAGLAVKLNSRGPVFYVQTRVGLHGRNYRLFKLRTMIMDAEATCGPVWSTRNDPRITAVGHFLRATHIDEFPQLFNVLLGEMSLVGPRPERPEFVARLQWELTYYCDRLNVKPGITGLAQLALPPDTCLESVRRKLVYDLYYVRRVGLWLDIRLLAHTGWRLVRNSLRCAARACGGLPKHNAIRHEIEQLVGCDSPLLEERPEVVPSPLTQ